MLYIETLEIKLNIEKFSFLFKGIIGGTAFAMFEGAVIAILREQNADYGLQRIFGSIGGMISAPLSGILIDYSSRGRNYTNYRSANVLFLFILQITLEFLRMIALE